MVRSHTLSELELMSYSNSLELSLIPHSQSSTIHCDARMPSGALRPSAWGFRLAKRTIAHHNHWHDIDPIRMKITSGSSQQPGDNPAGVRGRFPLHYPVMHDFVTVPTDIAQQHGFDGPVVVIATEGGPDRPMNRYEMPRVDLVSLLMSQGPTSC